MKTEQSQQEDLEPRVAALEQAVTALVALVAAKPAQQPKPSRNNEPSDQPSGRFKNLGGIERRPPHVFGFSEDGE